MKLRDSKIKVAIALFLVLCLTMPFISSIVSTHKKVTHTHICHDEKHDGDCGGTAECCNICHYFYDTKSQTLRCAFASKLSATHSPILSLLPSNFGFQHMPYISLISLKVRFNN